MSNKVLFTSSEERKGGFQKFVFNLKWLNCDMNVNESSRVESSRLKHGPRKKWLEKFWSKLTQLFFPDKRQVANNLQAAIARLPACDTGTF